ncbi:hypothetical protein [Hymenobacter jeollabukensis]|uniref:TfoX/Sxy family protein n=1 Tax=Hymenobacter jeollabukensis TaxID=2025313 RepID=A0A5R8WSS3_9BACT|nr:hypothetical protein [Hymenobacter jeollabukensis]TLM94230.1 hypothetical protein FDY95_09460 [Hymenobacter jeollabukensis]
MSTAETEFRAIGATQPAAEAGQLFGKPCFKINGKAFVCFFQEAMVFKLADEAHREALALDGARLFDPSGKGRPMKEWVQVPAEYHAQWPALAAAAHRYVSGQ